MTRFPPLAAAMAALLASAASAQEVTDPNLEVDTVALAPGDAIVIGFEAGFDHQLLRVRHRGAEALAVPLSPGEVRASLAVTGDTSELAIENGTGERLFFDALADRSGNGGFSPVPTASVEPGQAVIAGHWPFAVHTLTIGEFSYGPHGDHHHD